MTDTLTRIAAERQALLAEQQPPREPLPYEPEGVEDVCKVLRTAIDTGVHDLVHRSLTFDMDQHESRKPGRCGGFVTEPVECVVGAKAVFAIEIVLPIDELPVGWRLEGMAKVGCGGDLHVQQSGDEGATTMIELLNGETEALRDLARGQILPEAPCEVLPRRKFICVCTWPNWRITHSGLIYGFLLTVEMS